MATYALDCWKFRVTQRARNLIGAVPQPNTVADRDLIQTRRIHLTARNANLTIWSDYLIVVIACTSRIGTPDGSARPVRILAVTTNFVIGLRRFAFSTRAGGIAR